MNRKFWGWGYKEYSIDPKTLDQVKANIAFALGISSFPEAGKPKLDQLSLREPRCTIPSHLSEISSVDKADRASHTYGKAFRDVWRAVYEGFPNPPDYVLYPKSIEDIQAIFEYAAAQNIAVVPYGGGSSVTGGIEPRVGDQYNGCFSVDMKYFDQLLAIDQENQTAHFQAGIYGPALNQALKPHGLTLRHFPQSFEFSTLGGWIVTRAGGHYATLYTHIDEFVQQVNCVTPSGIYQSNKLPSSGGGIDDNALMIGSEGILGIITDAWIRVQKPPQFKTSATITFPSFEKGIQACQTIGQSGLYPSNARLIDALEAFQNGIGDGKQSVLILGFESASFPVNQLMDHALQICNSFEGTAKAKNPEKRSSTADQWKKSFLEAPYLRDELVRFGLIVETFETCTTWSNFQSFHSKIQQAFKEALKNQNCKGLLSCRFTHIYQDGPAPYYTIYANGENGKELENWDAIKTAVSEVIVSEGGTITHHHAIGRDHEPFFAKQKSPMYFSMIESLKKTVDPKRIMNPGVILPSKIK